MRTPPHWRCHRRTSITHDMKSVCFRLLLSISMFNQQFAEAEESHPLTSSEVVVTKLESHKSFCVELKMIEALNSSIDEHNLKAEALDLRMATAPIKGEFETTADFQNRIQKLQNNIAAEEQAVAATFDELTRKSEQLDKMKKYKEESLNNLVVPLKITMGKFDADKLTITSFTTQPFIFGEYDNRLAVVTTTCQMPSITSSIEVAKGLREASDKGELFCIVRLRTPKLKMVHGPISLPMTTGEKVSNGIFTFVLAAIAKSDPNTVRLQETKSQDANTIQIEGFASIQYLRFYNKDLNILAQQTEEPKASSDDPNNSLSRSADGPILDKNFKREKKTN